MIPKRATIKSGFVFKNYDKDVANRRAVACFVSHTRQPYAALSPPCPSLCKPRQQQNNNPILFGNTHIRTKIAQDVTHTACATTQHVAFSCRLPSLAFINSRPHHKQTGRTHHTHTNGLLIKQFVVNSAHLRESSRVCLLLRGLCETERLWLPSDITNDTLVRS